MHVIFAMHKDDWFEGFREQHERKNRGSRRLRLLEPTFPEPAALIDQDVIKYDMTVENVSCFCDSG